MASKRAENLSCPALCCALLFGSPAAGAAETHVLLDLEMGYDSNPSYLPESETGSTVWSIQPRVYFQAQPLPALDWYVYAGYNDNMSDLDARTVNLSSVTSPLVVEAPDSRVAWAMLGIETFPSGRSGLSAAFTRVDHQHDDSNFEYTLNALRLDSRLLLNDFNRLHANVEGQDIAYDTLTTLTTPYTVRSDQAISAELGWWHRWSPRYASDLALKYIRTDSNDVSVENDYVGASLSAWQFIGTRGRVSAHAEYGTRHFDQPVLLAAREDTLAELSLSYEYFQSATVSYSFSNKISDYQSDLSLAAYRRAVTSFKTTLSF